MSEQMQQDTLLKEVLLEHVTEQRRARRWGIFFKLVIIVYLIGFPLFLWMGKADEVEMKKPLAAASVQVYGPILATEFANAENIIESLEKAFAAKHIKGVILKINSPGGSPVQARYIYDEIIKLKTKYQKPCFAVIEDLGTSAAYLIATAADEIYADKTSLVGSIGVLISSFGFVDSMEKLGVERRLYTAGDRKGFLDPFSARKPEDEEFLKRQLSLVHEAFIENVQQGRKDKLQSDSKIFSGLFWSGKDAKALGLIDGFGTAKTLAEEKLAVKKVIDYTKSKTVFEKLSNKLGATLRLGLYEAFHGGGLPK